MLYCKCCEKECTKIVVKGVCAAYFYCTVCTNKRVCNPDFVLLLCICLKLPAVLMASAY